ncbi:hypothetical protein K461DRAFT_295425 [Myriangium duriaei CBS 260.36]|uniref:Uncharacterized protein n=1 Tax=Myriangium duriaei CBS 260.36 TaxID=1168546 RepID=A0A9P4J0T4_9PEZI|nr:hypothetical protein K461DRAFT_295425 [Myriangium duriaei CBS 260.36]
MDRPRSNRLHQLACHVPLPCLASIPETPPLEEDCEAPRKLEKTLSTNTLATPDVHAHVPADGTWKETQSDDTKEMYALPALEKDPAALEAGIHSQPRATWQMQRWRVILAAILLVLVLIAAVVGGVVGARLWRGTMGKAGM